MKYPEINQRFELIPKELTDRNQWVCWRYTRRQPGSDQWTKIPLSPTHGGYAKISDPSTWTGFDQAVDYFNMHKSDLAGVGFVFTSSDPFVGVDLDHCRTITDGKLTESAQSLINDLSTYTEVSPSGEGVKCIVKSMQPIPSRKNSELGVELYSSNRYFTITGHLIGDYNSINERTQQLLNLQQQIGPKAISGGPPFKPQSRQNIMSDDAVFLRASTARNGQKFNDLWHGKLLPAADGQSESDLSLCRILAFWCGPDPDQIDRLFRRSALFRPKWDERHYADGSSYGKETIAQAIKAQKVFFTPGYGTNRKKVSMTA